MLQQTSNEFRAEFLLRIVREIIENTETFKNLRAKKEAREFIKERKEGGKLPATPILDEETIREIKKEEIKEFVREKAKKESERLSEMQEHGLLPELKMIFSRPVQRPIIRPIVKKIPPFLKIPESTLPETVSYLKPLPTGEQIDIGRLNALVKDPLVKSMECNGPNENIIVMGAMGRKQTPITLNQQEIEEIVNVFSAASRIPFSEGLFKAAFGNLVISAVISEIAGIKFVIRKISFEF